MFDQELINQLVQRELQKEKAAETYTIKPEEQPAPFNPTTMSPKMAMMLGGAADVASTLSFLKRGTGKEKNPAFQYFNKNPMAVLPTAAAVGTGYHLLHKLLSKKSPKLANTIGGLLGGYQMGLGGRNFENTFNQQEGKKERKSSYVGVTEELRLKGNQQ
jgi:hypothetical protein